MLSKLDWKSMNFPKILWILTGIPRKSLKVLQNSGIPRYLESARFAETAIVILGNPEIFKYPTECRPWGRGWIFSGIAQYAIPKMKMLCNLTLSEKEFEAAVQYTINSTATGTSFQDILSYVTSSFSEWRIASKFHRAGYFSKLS